MARTLNPQLFGPIETPVVNVQPSSQAQNRKLNEIESQVEVLNQKLEKWVQILDGKIQQLHSNQKNLMEQIKNTAENFSKQQALMQSRINERKTAEVKTQELFDRHNQLIHNFEARVSQIQKVSNEQEMKLLSYQSTYDEIL
ncbi:MAG: hypothetical protein KDD38_00270, partial [Bdellovibrionales bacterium]|nr:hypothetical protein [Bdellovibrionales bacterium]